MSDEILDAERTVQDRYSVAARSREPALCCPVGYDPRLLEVIPREIRERDYGCGDPSRHLRAGDDVLDLGSGAGKICYIAAQVVGPEGSVVGVDLNEEMLALAESHRLTVGDRLGFHNVRFFRARIQDLALDVGALERRLAEQPVRDLESLQAIEAWAARQRREHPLIATASIDVVVSNCVLNLVRPEDKRQLFAEMLRVLRPGGRAVISDIVSDEEVPDSLMADPDLWSGCVSGAFREDTLLEAFEDAGFYGVEILSRAAEPWRVVEGIEFRAMTVRAWHAEAGPCLERRQAVIYRGPWRSVTDDDGHTLKRGRRMAVCDKTFRVYTREPYASQIEPVPPLEPTPLDQAPPFDCSPDAVRDITETKRAGASSTRRRDPCGRADGCC